MITIIIMLLIDVVWWLQIPMLVVEALIWFKITRNVDESYGYPPSANTFGCMAGWCQPMSIK
jgi:hypothetical protein